jgi:nucleoid-associated protein EbfC
MFKGLGNLGSILKQAQQIPGQIGRISEEMKSRRVVGSAGGGMVEIEVNGLMEVLRCHVDPQLVAQNDPEMLEDLIISAVNQAITKGKEMHAEMMHGLTGGMSLPGLDELMAKFIGTESGEPVPEVSKELEDPEEPKK